MLRPRGKKGTIYFKRRVPTEFARVHDSPFIDISMKTDSYTEAAAKAEAVWNELVQGWQDRLDNRSADAEKRFAAARRIARAHGFRYRQMSDIAQMPTIEVVERIEAIPERAGQPDVDVAAALLGAVDPPPLTISRALERYWDFSKAEVREKTPDQIRRWRNPKMKAIHNLISVVGDVRLDELSPDDMQDFQDWWLERIDDGDVSPNCLQEELLAITCNSEQIDNGVCFIYAHQD